MAKEKRAIGGPKIESPFTRKDHPNIPCGRPSNLQQTRKNQVLFASFFWERRTCGKASAKKKKKRVKWDLEKEGKFTVSPIKTERGTFGKKLSKGGKV